MIRLLCPHQLHLIMWIETHDAVPLPTFKHVANSIIVYDLVIHVVFYHLCVVFVLGVNKVPVITLHSIVVFIDVIVDGFFSCPVSLALDVFYVNELFILRGHEQWLLETILIDMVDCVINEKV